MKDSIVRILFYFEVVFKLLIKFTRSFSKQLLSTVVTKISDLRRYITKFLTFTKLKITTYYTKQKLLFEIRSKKVKGAIKEKYRRYIERRNEHKKEKERDRKKQLVFSNVTKYVEIIGNHPTVYNTLTDIVDLTIKQLDYEVNKLIKNDIYMIRPDSEEFIELTVRFVDRFRMNTGDVVYRSFCDWFGSEEKLLELITFLLYRKIATTLSSALETTLSELTSSE